jgi:site-specific DNA recombinase
MLKAAIYARYSSGLQRPTSIDDQIALCMDAASRFECEIATEHIYSDEERSGEIVEQRPGYQRLLQAAQRREFEAIIVEAQDRLWRNQAEMHVALRRLRFYGVRIFSVATATDLTGRAGRLLASIMGWKDEDFLEDLREKTRRGMLGQVKRGLSPGGRAYGYRSVPIYDETKRDAYGQPLVVGYRRAVNPDEAPNVRRIFEMYAAGQSPKTIAHRLNDEGIPAPSWREGAPQRGWTWSTINGSPKKAIGILNNPLYVGRLVWNRSCKVRDPDAGKRITCARPGSEWVFVDVPELRIIPDDLWHQVQARREALRWSGKGRIRDPRGGQRRHLLSGLLVCGECGAHYIIKTREYYGCASNINRGKSICSNTRLG